MGPIAKTAIAPMVSAHLGAIAEQLRSARVALSPAEAGNGDEGEVSEPVLAESALLSLDDGIKLKGESWIFPAVADASDDWCVLSSVVDDGSGSVDYLMLGDLPGSLAPADFLAQAYRLVLGREIDQQGLRAYSTVLAQARASRFDILRILADSDEAVDRAKPLIIVPQSMLDAGPAA